MQQRDHCELEKVCYYVTVLAYRAWLSFYPRFLFTNHHLSFSLVEIHLCLPLGAT